MKTRALLIVALACLALWLTGCRTEPPINGYHHPGAGEQLHPKKLDGLWMAGLAAVAISLILRTGRDVRLPTRTIPPVCPDLKPE